MKDIRKIPSLILASSSPRRKELLGKISIPFEVIDSDVDENTDPGSSPDAAAALLANRKALAVAEQYPDQIVVAADTIIDFRGKALGKPADDSDAAGMLRELRGKRHYVITGMALFKGDEGLRIVRTVSTEVWMKQYSEQEINDYVESGEPRDKAGSYAIQGSGGRLVESVRGCYNNVVGLPLCETVELLRIAGVGILPEGICQLPSGESCPRERKAVVND